MRPLILPVIHFADPELALYNARLAFDAGCAGVFLINMGDSVHTRYLASVAFSIKAEFPDKLVGINYLGSYPDDAVLRNLANGVDMTWTDFQMTHSAEAPFYYAAQVKAALAKRPGHLVFSGVAFKHQAHEPNPSAAARSAIDFGFVPTTSGPATGVAADIEKVRALRKAIGPDAPLAIASGITPENVADFAPYLSHILVATGVSESFHELDFEKLSRLCAVVRTLGA